MTDAVASALRQSQELVPDQRNLPLLFAAEETIARMSDEDVMELQERLSKNRSDGFLYLWLGLAARHRQQWTAALDAFGHAVNHGCSHWRTGWYIAQTARDAGQLQLVDHACAAVLKANSQFWFARELPKHARGYYSQIGQDKVVEQFFARCAPRNKVFVEVGAFDGVHYSNVRRLHEKYGWTGITFEPVSKNFKKVVAAYAGTPVKCVQAAVSTADSELEINVSTYPHLPDWGSDVATLGEADTTRWEKEFGATWTKEKVPVRRLTRLLDEAGIEDFDFISIDTEGHDLEVLKSIDFKRYHPLLIVIEYGENKAAIAEILKREGYGVLQDNGMDFIAQARVRHDSLPAVGAPRRASPEPDLSKVPAAQRDRVLKTISCRDAESIPKVANAGELVSGDPPLQVMHNGVKIVAGCYHGGWMTEIIRCLRGHHEPEEELMFHQVLTTLRPGAVMIECGAYWAYYSLWFHHVIDGAQNHLIEAVHEKLEAGRRNFAVNGFTGEFTHGFIGRTSAPSAPFHDWDGRVCHLPRVCIDDYIREKRIAFVDVLHADIQGAELDLLHGSRESIKAGKIGYIFISTHQDSAGSRHAPCLEFLREHGFTIIAEHSMAESSSVDGLIVAASPAVKSYLGGAARSPELPVTIASGELPRYLDRLNPHLVSLGTLPRDRTAYLATMPSADLLVPERFDLPAKILYARHRLLGVESNWARELYHAHISAFSNGTCREGDGRKDCLEDYFTAFHQLLDGIRDRGFDANCSLVPVGRGGVAIDGAHRIAAGFVADQPVAVLKFDCATSRFDAEFFRKRGLAEKWLDAIALQYCRLRPDTFVVTVFPSAIGKEDEVRALLNRHGRLVYAKQVVLNRRGARNLICELYAGESWLGDWRNNFAGANGKMEPCFRAERPVRVYVLQAPNLDVVRAAKVEIRELFGIANHSVHINDTHAQTLQLAQLFFNANSIHFLNHAQLKFFERFVRHLDRYRKWLGAEGRDPEYFCIDGSAVMAAYGLRDAQDLDVLHYGPADFGPVMPEVNSHNADAHHHTTTRDDIIFNPENHFYAFGLKFASIETIRRMKTRRDEGKDRKDVALIDASCGVSTEAPLGPRAADVPPKIIALIPARNEAARLPFCLRALQPYVDAVVYLDDCSDDDSVKVVESLAAECRVERIIRKTIWHRDEPGDRNALLAAGRNLGGTHFVVIDADEAFTANCAERNYLRRLLLTLRPGDSLTLSWIQLWRSLGEYRFDQSQWTYASKAFAFCDDGHATYQSGFIHTQRVPKGLGGRNIPVVNYVHGVMHFQFVNWPNLQIKQAWYRCMERIRQPQRAAAEINKQYAPSEDESGLQLREVPSDWLDGYSGLDASVFAARDDRRVREVLGWFREHRAAHFADLDIWRVDWATLCSDEQLAAEIRMAARRGPAPSKSFPLPPEARRHMAAAGAHLARGDVPACRASVESAFVEAPEHPEILAALGNMQFMAKEFVAARKHLEISLSLHGAQPKVWTQLAATQLQLKNHGGFVAALQKALELDPECAAALRLLADYQAQRGQHQAASGAYRKLTRLDARDASHWLNLGRALFAGGEMEEAEESLQQALTLDPKLTAARRALDELKRKNPNKSKSRPAEVETCAR